MTAASGFDNCACECIQQALNNVAGKNAPALRRDKVGIISFLRSPENMSGVEQLQLDPGNGKRKCVEMNWIQKLCEDTINEWKKVHPEFSESLKSGKYIFDNETVVKSLLHRALGYSHKEDKVFNSNGELLIAETVKHYPPDTTACIFWLKNRMPNDWRDRQEIKHSGSLNHRFASMTNSELLEYEKQYGIIK